LPTTAKALSCQHLQISLLGELRLCRDSRSLVLPASRKTRALLAYLAVTAKRHLRSELCGLFWEDAADPRAGLRWSLTQIRRTLGEHGSIAIRADRESVELQGDRVTTDLDRLKQLTQGGCTKASRDALIEASELFRGEFLEGLDLASCYAYHEWCIAEREMASRRHEQILLALVEHHSDDPEQALVHARALATHNPLNERGHIQLITVLGALGRRRAALAQYEQCCRIFERELGLGPPAGLEAARASLSVARLARSDGNAASISVPDAQAVAGRVRTRFIGRNEEIAQLAKSIELAMTGQERDVLLLSGVPGIGKSRLLDELASQITAVGGRFLRGRAFESEMVRPFGFWIDALRGLRDSDLPKMMHAALRPLTHTGSGGVTAGDRDSLFDAVVTALSHLARSGPVAVLVDDLHWIEASSAALLHYAMRSLTGTPVLFALTGRAGELEDNAAAQNLLAALAQSRRLRRFALEPLRDNEARALVGSVAQVAEPDRIVAQAQGNPLILLELARTQNAAGESASLLGHILETHLSRLSPGAAELLDWASAFGREFPLDVLIAAQGGEPGLAGQQLSELERHDLIRAAGDTGYAFSHDLIQQAAYSRVSQPRRRLIHKSIAMRLDRDMDAYPERCSEIAHHAGLGGQHELAARASVGAGEHGLRVFANREAAEAARRGLRHAAHIPDQAARARLDMALLRIQVLATSGLPLARLRPAASAIMLAIDAAHAHRLHAEVAQGYYLLSVVHQEAGQFDVAQQATLSAAQASDLSDALGRARQLANSARCLVELGRDIGRARELVVEASTLAKSAGVHEVEVRWCRGLLLHWDGHLDLAVREIDAAIVLATAAEDRWRQCKCLATVAMIELERGRPQQAIARATELKLAANRLGEAADAPLAQAIEALARQMTGEETSQLDVAIVKLRAADDKSRLACVLNLAATIQLEQKNFKVAGTFAADALAMAESIGEVNEAVAAQATLVQVAVALGDAEGARLMLKKLPPVLEVPGAFSAKAACAVKVARVGAERISAAVSGPAE
jgi:DNA-binding SARP family transcriptional activator/tetratricopeptide (TPR) repeat protein